MKNDYSFKLVAAIVIAGVLVAFMSPSHEQPNDQASAETPHTVAHAE